MRRIWSWNGVRVTPASLKPHLRWSFFRSVSAQTRLITTTQSWQPSPRVVRFSMPLSTALPSGFNRCLMDRARPNRRDADPARRGCSEQHLRSTQGGYSGYIQFSFGAFFLDAEDKARHNLAAALESIAAAGFSETELMAEGDEWQKPGSHDPDRVAKHWIDITFSRTQYTHPCQV